jgi:hypothetical protein
MVGPWPYLPLPDELPAPGCSIRISAGNKSQSCWAIFDSGSPFTCVPSSLAKRLRLRKKGEQNVGGAVGKGKIVPIHKVDVEFLGFVFRNLPVLALDGDAVEDLVLIGRDVMNSYYITLSGPQLEFSMRK